MGGQVPDARQKQTRSLGLHETEEGAARAFGTATRVAAHGNLCTINFNHSDHAEGAPDAHQPSCASWRTAEGSEESAKAVQGSVLAEENVSPQE